MFDKNILIGCDPEVFVKQGNEFKSAYGLIPGDKKKPFSVRNGAVQVDGMALEFNITPAKSEEEFILNVQDVFDQMKRMVPNYEVVTVPVAHFNGEYMRTQPKEALELGCDPDFNAWNGMVNEKPDGDRPMRTASGHVHIGWTNGKDINADFQHTLEAFNVGRQMDFFLGLPSLFYDDDKERREMYGKSGCVRIKPYGVEYRTLSNSWLRSDKLMGFVYRAAIAGMKSLSIGNSLDDKYGDIQDIINNSDKKEALKIIKKEGLEVCYG